MFTALFNFASSNPQNTNDTTSSLPVEPDQSIEIIPATRPLVPVNTDSVSIKSYAVQLIQYFNDNTKDAINEMEKALDELSEAYGGKAASTSLAAAAGVVFSKSRSSAPLDRVAQAQAEIVQIKAHSGIVRSPMAIDLIVGILGKSISGSWDEPPMISTYLNLPLGSFNHKLISKLLTAAGIPFDSALLAREGPNFYEALKSSPFQVEESHNNTTTPTEQLLDTISNEASPSLPVNNDPPAEFWQRLSFEM